MKKLMVALLICMIAMIVISGGTALADYEPVADTPYGIPVFASPDDINEEALLTIINGHGRKRLLDLFGGLRIVEDSDNQKYSMKTNINTTYFVADGQYMRCIESTGSGNFVNSIRFDLYDTDNPVSVTFYDSREPREWSINPEQALNNKLPFSIDGDKISNLMVMRSDEHYKCIFDYTNAEDDKIYKDFVIEIDPETSLIIKFAYHLISEGGREVVAADGSVQKTSSQDTITFGEISYAIDELPDCSQFEQYLAERAS